MAILRSSLIMFNTLGERITYCRNLLGLARNEMAEKMAGAISLPTLTRWELNTVTPSSKKIEALNNFFLSQGLTVSLEWLQGGRDFPPLSMDLKKFDSTHFDEIVYTTLVDIRNKIKDFYFQQVNSNFFRPILSFGDYVGGIAETNKKLLDNKLCFLCTESVATAGIYNYKDNVIQNPGGDVEMVKNDGRVIIGELQWMARRP